jgi:hypothetical protein
MRPRSNSRNTNPGQSVAGALAIVSGQHNPSMREFGTSGGGGRPRFSCLMAEKSIVWYPRARGPWTGGPMRVSNCSAERTRKDSMITASLLPVREVARALSQVSHKNLRAQPRVRISRAYPRALVKPIAQPFHTIGGDRREPCPCAQSAAHLTLSSSLF